MKGKTGRIRSLYLPLSSFFISIQPFPPTLGHHCRRGRGKGRRTRPVSLPAGNIPKSGGQWWNLGFFALPHYIGKWYATRYPSSHLKWSMLFLQEKLTKTKTIRQMIHRPLTQGCEGLISKQVFEDRNMQRTYMLLHLVKVYLWEIWIFSHDSRTERKLTFRRRAVSSARP